MNKKIDNKFWMGVCEAFAEASTCRINIGTILVKNKKLVATGYLGSLSGDYHCCDVDCLWVNNHGVFGSSDIGKSCIRTIHSEANAVLKCSERENIECYTTYQPCLNCLKLLLAIGVTKIVYIKPYKDENRDIFLGNLHMNRFMNVIIEKYEEDK